MDDGVLWAIIIGIIVVVLGLVFAECQYDDCLEAGFTEAQCDHQRFWHN